MRAYNVRAAVLTVSTAKAYGRGSDDSGLLLGQFARGMGAKVVGGDLVVENQEQIEARLRYWADSQHCTLILTTGGTGFSPTDVTPEATRAVIDREAPGIAEAMRLASRDHTVQWMLSRGVAGIRDDCLIVNFPGSPDSIRQMIAVLVPALPSAMAMLARPPAGPA